MTCRVFNNNYFYGEINSTDPYCGDENVQLTDNCLRVPAEGCVNTVVPQKSAKQCKAFCNLRWNVKGRAFIPPCARCRRNKICQPRSSQAGTQYFSCPKNCCQFSHPLPAPTLPFACLLLACRSTRMPPFPFCSS